MIPSVPLVHNSMKFRQEIMRKGLSFPNAVSISEIILGTSMKRVAEEVDPEL